MAGLPLDTLRHALEAMRLALKPEANGEVRTALDTACRALDEIDRESSAAATLRMHNPESDLLRKAVQDTNAALEQKIEELSLLRLVTDATSRAVHASDPFRVLLEKIVKLLKADNGSIMLMDWTSRQLIVRAASGDKDAGAIMARFELGEGIAGHVAETGRPIVIADVTKDTRYVQMEHHPPARGALLCFPLVVQSQTIGVINLSSYEPNTFTAETTRIAHIVAGQLGVAIENSRLYDEIKETKDYLENLVERAGAAIFTLDRAQVIASWNAGAREMYCLPAYEVLGCGVESFVAPTDLVSVQRAVDVVLHDGGVVSLEAAGQRGDGGVITTDLTLSPIRDSRGRIVGVSGIGKDISEQKRVEEELRSLNEAKSNFIAMVSHELRTPLTSVKSFVEIMTDDAVPTPEETRRRYLRIINEECDRLDNLISDLLSLQKSESGIVELRRQRFPMADVVKQAVELYAPSAERKAIELVQEIQDSTPPGDVEGDRDKLYQVLGNLLNNALKFTPERGRITLQQQTNPQHIQITVRDSGPGLQEDELGKVFDKFYQVEHTMTRQNEGTGLGLAICREIIAVHGGEIWAESPAGAGAVFQITLPRCT